MKISIVTISYNQAEFIERTICSVLDQDYNNIEYIVVDAGSTDGSREIIKQYETKISKIIFEPDAGPADGLNKGFACATGDIYGFLNSDDILLPYSLSHVANFFQKNMNIDVVSGHTIIIDEFDRKLRNFYSAKFYLLHYAYESGAFLAQQSTFFRAETFEKAGRFNIKNKSSWDAELFVNMGLHKAHFSLVNEFWSGFRSHPESITSSKKLDQQIKEYRKYQFRKIMGREQSPYDNILKYYFKILKLLQNKKQLYERLSKGPIYGRAKVSN